MELIHEETYAKEMDEQVIPWLMARRYSGAFSREPEKELYYEHFTCGDPDARPLVLLHGFSEFLPKWYESAYYLAKNGFSVWCLQQREHGKSYRCQPDPALIHLENYSSLVEDLHFFVQEIVTKREPAAKKELYLMAHSMGGGVGACCLERYSDDFTKAVLSSPMLEMSTGGTPLILAQILCRGKILLGKGRDYMAGSVPFRPVPDFAGSLDDSEARYQYVFEIIRSHEEYQMCVPSYQTALQLFLLTKEAQKPQNCRSVKADVLLLQAGKDTMVGLDGQRSFIRQIPHGRIETFPQAKHELYMQRNKELQQYWKYILDFFA